MDFVTFFFDFCRNKTLSIMNLWWKSRTFVSTLFVFCSRNCWTWPNFSHCNRDNHITFEKSCFDEHPYFECSLDLRHRTRKNLQRGTRVYCFRPAHNLSIAKIQREHVSVTSICDAIPASFGYCLCSVCLWSPYEKGRSAENGSNSVSSE